MRMVRPVRGIVRSHPPGYSQRGETVRKGRKPSSQWPYKPSARSPFVQSRLSDRFESAPLSSSVNSEKTPGVAAVWNET